MTLQVGIACHYAEPPPVDDLVRLMTDARWPWQPQLMKIGNVSNRALTPQVKGKIPIARLPAALREALAATTAADVMLACSRQQALDHAWILVDTGNGMPLYRVPFAMKAMTRAEALPAGKSIVAWLALAEELVRTVRAVHGTIVVAREDDHVSNDLWLSLTIRNGRATHPHAMEIQRAAAKRHSLGEKYVRPVRWGNYLPPFAVDAAGGRARIEGVVAPAIVREVGSLLYVQLSERIDDALAPATEAKRRALRDLLAPVAPPTA